MSRTAPGDLETLRAFVNSRDPDTGQDDLADRESLAAWMVGHRLLGPDEHADFAQHRRALQLREALRRLAEGNHDGVADEAAADEIDRLASECRLVVRMGHDGVARLEPASGGMDGALDRLLGLLFTATVDGTWPRFKVCSNGECRWAFYDVSKNRSGRWCGSNCANTMNARAYRLRKAAPLPSGGPQL